MPTLNQTGELKAIFWWTIRWVSSALNVCEVRVRREVALGLRPGRDRVDDAIDELLDAGLALRRAEVAAEVLADDDVGGELRPEVGDLDVLLLEDALAGLVGDAGGPVLPGDLVVGMDTRRGPAALEGQARGLGLAVRQRCHRSRRPTGRRDDGSSAAASSSRRVASLSMTGTVLPLARAICLSFRSFRRHSRGSCRIHCVVERPRVSWGLPRIRRWGVRRGIDGRLGVWRPDLTIRFDASGSSSPKPQDVVVARHARALHVVV